MTEKNKPHAEVKLGRIVIPIWKNVSDDGTVRFNMTSPKRLYKIGDAKWRTTDSLGRDDALNAALALEQATLRIYDLEALERQKKEVEEAA